MDLTSALLAYDNEMDKAKREGREPSTADKFRAMKAAIEAYEGDKANVMPPLRGTDSLQDAGITMLSDGEINDLYISHTFTEASNSELNFARDIEAEVSRRFRAQGGDTSNEKDNNAR